MSAQSVVVYTRLVEKTEDGYLVDLILNGKLSGRCLLQEDTYQAIELAQQDGPADLEDAVEYLKGLDL